MITAVQRRLQILNIAGFLLVVITNVLANALPINGVTTGGVADNYPNLITPAGITFSIWLVIYFFLGGFTFYQAKPLFNDQATLGPWFERVGSLFFVSCILNVGWLFAWHYQILPLSLVFMIGLLGTLVVIFLNLYDEEDTISTRQDRLWVLIPFSIYLAWIVIATLANATVVLIDFDVQLKSDFATFWVMALVAVTSLVLTYMTFEFDNNYLNLVAIWAFLGIILKTYRGDDFIGKNTLIIGIGIAVFTLAMVLVARRLRWFGSSS